MDPAARLAAEWQTLQAQQEQYERSALTVKLCALVVSVAALAVGLHEVLVGSFVALFWLQEGIFKTFQGRLCARLVRVEALLAQPAADAGQAMQLHTEWQAGRPGGLALVGEYLASALRPTVAFPYLPLLVIVAIAGMA